MLCIHSVLYVPQYWKQNYLWQKHMYNLEKQEKKIQKRF